MLAFRLRCASAWSCDMSSAAAAAEPFRRLPLGSLLATIRSDLVDVGPMLQAAPPGTVATHLAEAVGDALTWAELLRCFAGPETARHARRPPVHWARLATVYADLVARGVRSPAKEISAIARTHNGDQTSPQVWADRIAKARDMGLLTPTERGRASGTLTKRARVLLDAEDSDSDRDEGD